MEDYLLITNKQRQNLIGIAQMVARQRKTNLFIVTDHKEAKKLNIHYFEPALLVKHTILGKKQIEGEKEIIDYLREQQFKIPY